MPPSTPSVITRPVVEILGRHLGYGFAGLGVNTAIGNFTQTSADLTFPAGTLGLLNWTRTYNSLSGTVGLLGTGWTTAFSARLEITTQGVLHHTAGPVAFHDDDGRALIFLPASGGGYTTPQDVDASLAESSDGSFTLTYLSGAVWSFDSTGRGTTRSLEGQTVTLDYDVNGLLLRASHSSGRHFSLSYDSDGRLIAVESDDGRTASYGYASDGTLASVAAPGGGVTQFTTATGGPFLQVASITNADGNLVVANTYDPATQRVTTQRFPTGGGAEFGYSDSGLTTVTSTPSNAQLTFQADANGRMTRGTDPFGEAATFAYNSDGRLTEAVTPGGTQLTQTYDAAGNVLTSAYGGASTAWTYDSANRVITAENPVGATTAYAYSGDSHVPTQITGPDGGVVTQLVENGLITSRTNADGETTVFAYDAFGNLTSVTDALGEQRQFTYDAAGNRAGFIAASGATATWAYDAAGRLISATDPDNDVTSYSYSPGGLLLQTTDAIGVVAAAKYTAAGLMSSLTDGLGRVTTFGYDDDGNLTTITDAAGAVTTAGYDALGRVTTITDAVGTVVTLSYDADGNQVSEQTEAGITRATFDARGNRISVTDAAGATASFTYDLADQLIRATGPDGSTWTTTYDAAGHVIATTDPLHAVTRQTWTSAGWLATVTDAIGRQTSYGRDKVGRITEVTDAQGGTIAYAFDADGRKISATTPAGLITRFSHDAAGRLVTSTDPRGWITETVYNPRGEKIETITADGAISRFTYDAAGQLTQIIDPNGSITQYGYDQAGHLISITDAKGAATRFGYDAAGRQTSVTDPLGRVTTSEYDKAGNLIAVTDPAGHTQNFSYDADRRLIRKTAEGAVDVSFTYDSSGRRISMTDATGTTHYAYDAAGRLLTVTDPDGQVTTAEYDAAGQRTSLAYPGGLLTRYTYDDNGRLTALNDSRAGQALFVLDPDGQLLTEQLPGRLARRYHYEGGLAHRYLVIRDGQPVTTADFTRDPSGRIASDQDGNQLTRYAYDPVGQLVSVVRHSLIPRPEPAARPPRRGDPASHDGYEKTRFTYDAVGNRTSLQHDDVHIHYRYDVADQLVASETGGRHVEYRYDPSGQLAEEIAGDSRRTISYDGFGRPVVAVRTSPGLTERAEATFNGDGLLNSLVLTNEDDRREQQRSASVSYRWGSFGQIPQILAQRAAPELDDAEHDRAGRLSADFSYGYSRTFASNEHVAAVFHRDSYGSQVRTEDTEPWVLADHYDVFGMPVRSSEREYAGRDPGAPHPPELPRFGYGGELALGSMIDLRARFYDAELGRFTSRDPVAPHVGPSHASNPYAYAANDPLNLADPLGTLAFFSSLVGDILGLARAAAAPARKAAPTTQLPLGECPGDPSTGTLMQLSQALKQPNPNFGLIASILHITPTNLLFAEPPPPPVVHFTAPTCGHLGTGCNATQPIYQNSNTAIPLGLEFLTGFGSRNQYFNQWDPFTQMLMKEPYIRETITQFVQPDLQCGIYVNSNDYSDPKTHIFGDIAGAFTDGRLPGSTDPAVGFLGSYNLTWAAVPTSEKKAQVFFTVTNETDLNSLIHPEFFTFGGIRSIDGIRPIIGGLFGALTGGPILGALGAWRAFHPTTQKIQWQETVSYTYYSAPIFRKVL
jgi:RHS repeat-associated protein